VDILRTLERIGAPYMIIGGFAATMYGSVRTTYDIDIVVDLSEDHIEQLTVAYPPPRFYADPHQMRNSIRLGISFNIIDGERGEKADLNPLTRDSRYRQAFERRVRQGLAWQGEEPFDVWCARPDDVIFGKLLAWDEGRSARHESDIFAMVLTSYEDPDPTRLLDEAYLDARAEELGPEVADLWQAIKLTARRAAGRE
jgi:hypothetical protein